MKKDIKKSHTDVKKGNEKHTHFEELGIAPKILGLIKELKLTKPTPIQFKAIPVALEKNDVVGIAQSGTGKTLAFAIPMVQILAENKGKGLVLAPTRELALQIEETFKKLANAFNLNCTCLIGGAPIYSQIKSLKKNPRIVIATPGRLLDHMKRKNFIPGDISMIVLDEADHMLDMGFTPQVEEILSKVTKKHQTMLFSATMPPEMIRMIKKHMQLPVHVEIAPPGTTAEGIMQELYIVKREAKMGLLKKVLSEQHGSVLLFTRTKNSARKMAKTISGIEGKAIDIHSDKSLGQRREALAGFKSGRYRVLVATDVASRGIDVEKIEIVINYDLPDDISNYVHRIGRTGRAGKRGKAISFATPDQKRDVRNIENLIRMQLPVVNHSEITQPAFDMRLKKAAPSRDAYKKRFHARKAKNHRYSKKA